MAPIHKPKVQEARTKLPFSVLTSILILLFFLASSCGGGGGGSSSQAAVEDKSYLPVLSIRTTDEAPVVSKEEYLTGTFEITDLNGDVIHGGGLEIKGRGNTTWQMPKKPFRLKLAASTALMGMPANRHWVLLANYSDKTLIRNDLAFELSRMLEMEYTPRSVFVEVELNDEYLGVYQLTEHIRIGSNRVNIPELKATDTAPDKISGGYLIEVDSYRGEVFCFDTPEGILNQTGMAFCLSNPETLLEPDWEQQRLYIEDFLSTVDEVLFSPDFSDPDIGYESLLDVDSVVGWYLVNEILKNIDGHLNRSAYMYKKRDGKLFFGPVWDFDLAVGNYNVGSPAEPNGWYARNAAWYRRLFEDPAFEAKVRDRWNQLKTEGKLTDLFEYIEARALLLKDAQRKNFQRWDILNTYVWPNRVVTGSYQGEIAVMKLWLQERIEWLDAQLSP